MKKLTISSLGLLFIVYAIGFTACDDNTTRDSLAVSPETFTFKSRDKSSKEFKVTQKADTYKAELNNPSDDWVKIDQKGESFFVTVDDYTDQAATKNREATILVTSGTAEPVTVTIYQEFPGEQPITLYDIILSRDRLSFDGKEELTKSVEVNTVIDYTDITVVCEEAWISSAELVDGELVVTVSENDDAVREGTITLKSDKAIADAVLKIYQNVIPVLELQGDWELIYTGCYYNFPEMQINKGSHMTTAVITYDEQKDYYLMRFRTYVSMDSEIKEVVLILHYDEQTDEVSFEHGIDMSDFYVDDSVPSNNYYSFIAFDDDMKFILPFGYKITFRVSEDKRRLASLRYFEYSGEEHLFCFGYGRAASAKDVSRDGIEQGFLMKNFTLKKLK